MALVFDTNFHNGQIHDSISGTVGTIVNSARLKDCKKGMALSLNGNQEITFGNIASLNFATDATKPISIDFMVDLNKHPVGAFQSGGFGKGGGDPTSSSGRSRGFGIDMVERVPAIYFVLLSGPSNGFYTTVPTKRGLSHFTLIYDGSGLTSGINIYQDGIKYRASAVLVGAYTGCNNSSTARIGGEGNNALSPGRSMKGDVYRARVYDHALSEKEVGELQEEFIEMQPTQPKKTNFIKEANRGQVNFDLNIKGSNYVTVADNNSLDFGTGSFSIYREDSYPQLQSNVNGGIISKDQNAGVGSRCIVHNVGDTSQLRYIERSGVDFTTTSIPNGQHKFLFYRDVSTSRAYFICDGVVIATSTNYPFQSLTNTQILQIKSFFSSNTRSSGDFHNLRIWNTVKTRSQAIRNDRVNQVLDLPMDEGQGLICYDRSGNGNNGTITTTTPKQRKKTQVKSDILFSENFKLDKADGQTVVPRGRIKGTGNYKLVAETTASIVGKGNNYLECTSAGTLTYPIAQAYGTWEMSFYNASITQVFHIISNDIQQTNDYAFDFSGGARRIRFWIGNNATSIFYTNSNYISASTRYRIKITRSAIGVWTFYIKGGAFGDTYTLVSTSGGVGSNPATNNTYTLSNFFILNFGVGDRIANIQTNSQII